MKVASVMLGLMISGDVSVHIWEWENLANIHRKIKFVFLNCLLILEDIFGQEHILDCQIIYMSLWTEKTIIGNLSERVLDGKQFKDLALPMNI